MMRLRRRARIRGFLGTRALVVLGVFAIAVLTACEASEELDAAHVVDPDEGGTFTTEIVAAEGGVVTSPSGGAILNIPAGSLAEDTEISVAVLPGSDDSVSSVYDFGPDGTRFDPPAMMSIRFAAWPEVDEELRLATFVDGAWEEIPGSEYDGGYVNGMVGHFSMFAIVKRLLPIDKDAGDTCKGELCDEAPLGACCHPSLQQVNANGLAPVRCVDEVSEYRCNLLEGSWTEAISCAKLEESGDCEALGACCSKDGTCAHDSTKDTCAEQGGVFGEGLSCSEAGCPQTGACCQGEGVCADATDLASCETVDGSFFFGRECADLSAEESRAANAPT